MQGSLWLAATLVVLTAMACKTEKIATPAIWLSAYPTPFEKKRLVLKTE